MGSKSPLVILMMVTLLCAIVPAALGAMLPPSASFAQQEETSLGEEEIEDPVGDNIVSDVLDSVDDEEENGEAAASGDGDINRQIAVPRIDQDQGAANLALNEALDVTVVEPRPPLPPTTTPPDDGGLEPECALEITTDKEIYGPEDTVAITITNTGDIPIEFPDSFLGLEIRNVDTEEVFSIDTQPGVFTFQPGASATFQFTYESLVNEIGDGLISATVPSECSGTVEEVIFTLTALPPPPDEEVTTNYDTGLIFCNFNDGTPQQCDVPFRVTIETTSVLKVGVTVSPLHCSSTNFYVSVDGDEDTFGGTFIGRAGYPAIFGGDDDLTIPLHDFGTVESGSHTLDIWVEGILGGCNVNGFLAAWGATVTVITSELPQA